MEATDNNRTVTEASQMGWRPGHWPVAFQADGVWLSRKQAIYHHGELAGVEYAVDDAPGRVLMVLND